MANPPGGCTPVGGICTICPHGTIRVRVWNHAVCWDTPKGPWQAAMDSPLKGVQVTVNVAPQPITQPTGGSGEAVFENLCAPFTYTLSVRHPGYDDKTSEFERDSAGQLNPERVEPGSQVQPRTSVEVLPGSTSFADIILRAKEARTNPDGSWTQGRECLRRHDLPITPFPGGPTLSPMFWADEPPLLVARDTLWLALPAVVALGIVVGAMVPAMFPFALGAFALALWSYFGTVIFGFPFGVWAIPLAGAAYVALMVLNALAAAAPSWLPLPAADPWGMGLLTGLWGAFTIGYAVRDDRWSAGRFFSGKFLAYTLTGIALGMIVTLALAGGSNQFLIGLIILVLILIGPFAAIGAWAGAIFRNEGETRQPFGETDLLLPFHGERYCLQGPYGFWTHHDEAEGCSDFSMPAGTPVMCSKEGHIIAYTDTKEFLEDQAPSRDAPSPHDTNYVRIRHKEGAVAAYANLNTDSVTQEIPGILNAFGPLASTDAMASMASHVNPLHVQAGQILARSGYTRPPVPSSQPAWWVFVLGFLWAAVTFGIVLLIPALDSDGEPPTELTFPAGADHCYHYATYHDDEIRRRDWDDLYKPEKRVSDRAIQQDAECAKFAPVEDTALEPPAAPADLPLWNRCEALKDPLRKRSNLCYCEELSNGLIEEPANTWSDLGFIALGLTIMFLFAKDGPNGLPYKNRMTTTTFYPFLFGLVLIFMGPGSMYFHAWQIVIGGSFDGVSMYALCCFMIGYNMARMTENDAWFHGLFWPLLVIFTVINFVLMATKTYQTDILMYILMGLALLLQLIAACFPHIQTDHFGRVMFILGAVFLILAGVFQITSRIDMPLCNQDWDVFSPTSAIQGHAIWHILAAIGLTLIYLYFRHQMNRPPNEEFPRLHFAVLEKPPAGNPIDENPREPQPGQIIPTMKYKPVKFKDPGTTIHGERPRSMRKHLSMNGMMAPPPVPPAFAKFRPNDNGTHPAPVQ